MHVALLHNADAQTQVLGSPGTWSFPSAPMVMQRATQYVPSRGQVGPSGLAGVTNEMSAHKRLCQVQFCHVQNSSLAIEQ